MSSPSTGAPASAQPALERRIGPLQATAINMTQMCGIGPFVTIPAMVATIGGPEAMFGWIVGAILALADGLIWAELGAAMPGAGGTYIYLREAFQYRTGRLMPFLFVWSAVLFIPLIMSTGIIGLVQYLGYLIPGVTDDAGNTALGKIIGVGITLLIMAALFRKIGQIGKLTTVLFVVMLVAVLSTIVAAFSHFSGAQAFAFTPGAFGFSGGTFWAGLGAGLIIADLRLPRLQHHRLPRRRGARPRPHHPAVHRLLDPRHHEPVLPAADRRARLAPARRAQDRHLGRLDGARAGLGIGCRAGDHRAHRRRGHRLGVRRPARRVPRPVRSRPGQGLPAGVRQAASRS